MKFKRYIFGVLFAILFGCSPNTKVTYLFIGSFTEAQPTAGIQVYEFDSSSGAVKRVYQEDCTINPSFLKVSADGRFLYSVLESQMPTHGKVAAFAIDSLTGKLQLLNTQESGGRNPAHLALHPSGRYLVNSNYTDAGIALFKINTNGRLQKSHQLLEFTDSSIVKGRQDKAHLHSTNFSPDGNFLFGHDLGSDKIRAFTINEGNKGVLRLKSSGHIAVKPGSGPRHFTFHPNGKYGYGISELSGTITAYSYQKGRLKYLKEYLSYSKKQELYRAADIHISPDGAFLYASNRGPDEDSISIFSIDQSTGELALVGHEPTYGKHPRNFCLDPSGRYLLVANQFSGNVVIFERHVQKGTLTKLEHEIKMDNPSSLQMTSFAN